MARYVEPQKLLKSFTCPICGTLASMEWDEILIMYDGNKRFYFDNKETFGDGIIRISTCNACEGYHIWFRDDMVFPICSQIELPNENMPEDVKKIYIEARDVFDKSPRSSCALLRLGIQKLCDNLVEGDENLNDKIGSLVYCITDISPNNLYKFSSAALSSIDVATATPHSSALQTENLSCVI